MFIVKLSSCGNPDYGQPDPISIDENVTITSFREASHVCRQYIENNYLGSGNWSGGQVFDGDNIQIGRISFNGRVWDMNDNEIPVMKGL